MSQGISWAALDQTVCAVRFFYGVRLNRAEIPERIAFACRPRKLPTIPNADEVVRFLEAVPSLKASAALTTAYAAGLHASEAVSLKVTDIDSDRMVLQICHGKGAKDRTVMLSPRLLDVLRTYWRPPRPPRWLFPGRGDKPIDVQTLYAACRSATKAAGLTKKVSVPYQVTCSSHCETQGVTSPDVSLKRAPYSYYSCPKSRHMTRARYAPKIV